MSNELGSLGNNADSIEGSFNAVNRDVQFYVLGIMGIVRVRLLESRLASGSAGIDRKSVV